MQFNRLLEGNPPTRRSGRSLWHVRDGGGGMTHALSRTHSEVWKTSETSEEDQSRVQRPFLTLIIPHAEHHMPTTRATLFRLSGSLSC